MGDDRPVLDLPRPDWSEGDFVVPDPGTIVIVRVRLSAWKPSWDRTIDDILTDDEQSRAARFQFEADRRRHRLGRLVARLGLGDASSQEPSEIELTEGAHEKPHAPALPITFSITHGGDTVLVAFANNRPVGVDVEPIDRTDGADGLARSVLTDREFERWSTYPSDHRAAFFMHVWTVKESLIKATGEGLARDPTTVECEFDDDSATGFRRLAPTETRIDAGTPSDWRVHAFRVDDDAVAATTHQSTSDGSEYRFVPFSRLLADT